MKKLVAMFLALVLVVGCFAGCGAKGGNDGGEQEYKVAMVTDFGASPTSPLTRPLTKHVRHSAKTTVLNLTTSSPLATPPLTVLQ